MTSDALDPLARTAIGTAAIRAAESKRSDALFVDPLAAPLAGERAVAWLERQSTNLGFWPVIRTRFLDDLLDQWMQQTPIRQVVLLAAGLDTRAYRLTWPEGTCIFELDQAEVMNYKEHILAQNRALPQCQRLCLSVHLEQPWAEKLISAGFEAEQPSIWILEGLLYYLQVEVAQQVMETVSQLAAAGSWLGLDLVNQATLASSKLQIYQERRQRAGIPWHFGVDEPQQWLLELGWQASVSTLGEVAARYGRWSPPSQPPIQSSSSDERSRVFFIAAQRVENV